MLAIALALGSSACWGAADFLGGLKSRAVPVQVVLCVMYVTSLVVVAIAVLASGEQPPPGDAALAALAAGVFGIAALGAFYSALAIGTMSIVAPVSATGVVIPVAVGLAGGDSPGLAASLGLPLAILGVVLASREPDEATLERGVHDARLARRSIVLALVAGMGFGLYFVGADRASDDSVIWALLLSRVIAAPILVGLVLVLARRAGRGTRLGAVQLAQLAGIGMLDLLANALYNVATTEGELSGVAVAGSLYPVATVLLAAGLLGERVRGVQAAGVVAALMGVVLIAAG